MQASRRVNPPPVRHLVKRFKGLGSLSCAGSLGPCKGSRDLALHRGAKQLKVLTQSFEFILAPGCKAHVTATGQVS